MAGAPRNRSGTVPAAPLWGPEELSAVRQAIRGRGRPWDLVVVGAGITGAGVARDAAMRGLEVLVIEAQDVAFGTSSRSSRLVHGGVRYLEQAQLGLVFEALRERGRLISGARHLVRPARFLFPTYRGDRLGPWRLRLGLTLYDALNFYRGDAHAYLPPEQCIAQEPLLAAEGLLGAVQYEDAITDDARLTLTVLQDARRHGAEVLTYAEVSKIEREGDALTVTVGDDRTQTRHAVVATGPWTGRRLLGSSGDHLLALSKGIHLVMRASDVPVRQPVVVQAPNQRRILFVVPWGARTYLGTTDAPFVGDPARSGVTAQDEVELLDTVRRLLPGADLRSERIVSAWSGVRPLVRDPSPRGSDTVEMSRRHRLVQNADGVIGIVGGKLTTFRAMAQEVVDRVVADLGLDAPACDTHRQPLVPGEPLNSDELRDPIAADLNPRHGAGTRRLLARVREDPALSARLIDDLPYRWCEVSEAIAREGVTHLIDLLRRRLPLALTDVDLGAGVARSIAQRLVDAQGGSSADVEDELDLYREQIQLETRRIPQLCEAP